MLTDTFRAAVVLAAGLVLAAGPVLPAALAPPAYADQPGPAKPKKEFTINDPRIVESSGLTRGTLHPATYFTVNDSGHPAEVYAVSNDGEVVGALTLGEVTPRDWEAIASGPENRIWIGDIGDNQGTAQSVTLYRIREPETIADESMLWSRFEFAYDDGSHDAETLLVDPDTAQVFVVTKEVGGGGIYAGPEVPSEGVNTLNRIGDAPRLVTDGAFLPDGSGVVLRSYGEAYVLDWPSAKVRKTIPLPRQPQGESLAVTADGKRILVGTEGDNSPVYSVPLEGKVVVPSPTKTAGSGSQGGGDEQDPAAAEDEGGSLFGGLPWWVPALVFGIALVAGIAAYPRARGRPSGRRAA